MGKNKKIKYLIIIITLLIFLGIFIISIFILPYGKLGPKPTVPNNKELLIKIEDGSGDCNMTGKNLFLIKNIGNEPINITEYLLLVKDPNTGELIGAEVNRSNSENITCMKKNDIVSFDLDRTFPHDTQIRISVWNGRDVVNSKYIKIF